MMSCANAEQIVPEYKTVKVYVHGSKESLWNTGEEMGMAEEAARRFAYTLYEVEIELTVNIQTGVATISGCDGKKLVSQ